MPGNKQSELEYTQVINGLQHLSITRMTPNTHIQAFIFDTDGFCGQDRILRQNFKLKMNYMLQYLKKERKKDRQTDRKKERTNHYENMSM